MRNFIFSDVLFFLTFPLYSCTPFYMETAKRATMDLDIYTLLVSHHPRCSPFPVSGSRLPPMNSNHIIHFCNSLHAHRKMTLALQR